MQYGIRAIEKVGKHSSVVASERQLQCVGRARSQAVSSKAHQGDSMERYPERYFHIIVPGQPKFDFNPR